MASRKGRLRKRHRTPVALWRVLLLVGVLIALSGQTALANVTVSLWGWNNKAGHVGWTHGEIEAWVEGECVSFKVEVTKKGNAAESTEVYLSYDYSRSGIDGYENLENVLSLLPAGTMTGPHDDPTDPGVKYYKWHLDFPAGSGGTTYTLEYCGRLSYEAGLWSGASLHMHASTSGPGGGHDVPLKASLIKTPNLYVTKSATPACDSISYTLSYGNASGDNVTDQVGTKLVDDYDETKVNVGSISHSGSDDGDKITWSLGTVGVGASETVSYSATLLTSVPHGDTISNTATISGDLAERIADQSDNTATVSVTVNCVNDPPDAVDDSDTTTEDTPVDINVLSNDSDPEGDALTVTSASDPPHGSTAINPDGTVKYTPDEGYCGDDSFTYTISDGSLTDTAKVDVTVTCVNDPPVANDDSYPWANEDSTLNVSAGAGVLGNDTDPDPGDTLTVTNTGTITTTKGGTVNMNADGSFTYDPPADFCGQDSFDYSISDGNGGTDTATVTLDVACVDDPLDAINDAFTGDEDTQVTGNVLSDNGLGADLLGDQPTTVTAFDAVSVEGGTVNVNSDGSFTYNPLADFYGTDTFTYIITDSDGDTDIATVTITVTPIEYTLTVNIVGDGTVVKDPDQPSYHYGDVVDLDPQAALGWQFSGCSGDLSGSADPTTITMDGDKAVTATFNSLPVANDDTASTDEETAITVDVLGNDTDPDGDTIFVLSLDTTGVQGVVTNNGSNVMYDPNGQFGYFKPGEMAAETFTYTVSDGNGGTDTATVTVTILGANHSPPVALGDAYSVDEGVTLTVAPLGVLTNDSDEDGDSLTPTVTTNVTHGTLSLNPDGSFTYTPEPDFCGEDTFLYELSDGQLVSDTATVTITVNCINDLPVAVDNDFSGCKNTPIPLTLVASDPDINQNPEGPKPHPITFNILGPPDHGLVFGEFSEVIYSAPHVAQLRVTYVPSPNFVGTDTFAFLVSDPFGESEVGVVQIIVEECGEESPVGEGALTAAEVIISEVAWAGTEVSSDHEWIELANNTGDAVDLDGWVLRWRRKHPSRPAEALWKEVKLSGKILSYDFYLLERTHDDVVKDIQADLIYDTEKPYRLELSDAGEVMELLDSQGNVVDTANAYHPERDGWPGGYSGGGPFRRGTMERIDPFGPDLDDNWSINRGIIIRGLNAASDLLTATSKAKNEETQRRALMSQPPLVVPTGKEFTILMTFSPDIAEIAVLPWVTLILADEVDGGGGAILEEQSVQTAVTAKRLGGVLHYGITLDTAQLPPGTYQLWVTQGNGSFLSILLQVVDGA